MTVTEVASVPKISRSERKRRETRSKIIAATLELLRSRALDELTIAEITAAADVGHGTFYLHFKSKHEVMVPIFQDKVQHWDSAILSVRPSTQDPAVAVATSTRFICRMILADPLCRWFLHDAGFPVDEVREALGQFVARDIQLGLSAGRFHGTELDLTAHYLIGGAVVCLTSLFDADDPTRQIDAIAELMLRSLGVPWDEAREIAGLPLPSVSGR